MKLVFLVCIVLVVAVEQAYSQTCHMREVDLCLATGMLHFQSNGIPEDEEKVNEWCEVITEMRECMGNYSTKCLSPVQRELVGLLDGSADAATELCTKGSEVRVRYLEYGECLSIASNGDEFKTEVKDIQVAVETLFDTPFTKRFPLLCCSCRRFRKGIEDIATKNCGEGSANMVHDIVRMITTDLPDIVCQQYDPQSDECKALLPPSGTPSKGAQNKSQLGKLLDTALGNL